MLLAKKLIIGFNKLLLLRILSQAIYNEKNDLLSTVTSNNIVNCVEHLVEYLSCKVFGQAIYRHVTYNKKGVLYPIAYFLKQLSLAKCNYKIYNKELLAIIRYFKQ